MTPSTADRLLILGDNRSALAAAQRALAVAGAAHRSLGVVLAGPEHFASHDVAAEPHVDVMVGFTPQHVNLHSGTVEFTEDATGSEKLVAFDQLMFATGAQPLTPSWLEGSTAPVVARRDDVGPWVANLPATVGSVVVCGSGVVAIDLAEALAASGRTVTLVMAPDHPLTGRADDGLTDAASKALHDRGVDIRTRTFVEGAHPGPGGRIVVSVAGGQDLTADMVVAAPELVPNTRLARSAGLPTGRSGGLLPDNRQRLGLGVWAAGACCEVRHRVLRKHTYLPHAEHAEDMCAVAGTNIAGGRAVFPGLVGASVFRIGNRVLASAGLGTHNIADAGLDADDVVTRRVDLAPLAVSLTAERSSGRVIGGYVVSDAQYAGVINTIAAALWAGFDVAHLALSDMVSLPPWHAGPNPIQIVCRDVAANL